MDELTKIEAKLKRPPSAANWVRYNHITQKDTTRAIAQFALGFPRSALFKIYRILADMVVWHTPLDQALKAVALIENPQTAQLGSEIVNAFSAYNEQAKLDGLEIFADTEGLFRVSRDVTVPVRPTFVILKEGRPTPVFFIGWTSLPFSTHHKRLLTTIIEDAILSFGDFIGSEAEIICAPRIGKRARKIISWSTSDFHRLYPEELTAQLDRFSTGLVEALPVVKAELQRREALEAAKQKTTGRSAPSKDTDDRQTGLFD